jgi:uncharacterized protein
VIRSFPSRGHRVWGARTLVDIESGNSEWKYVSVRRFFNFLELSIQRGLQWVVTEPNEEATWQAVRSQVAGFLHSLWKQGAMQGATPKEAYFVKCDASTMTPDDIDNGRMVCLVGVAALKPAEFMVVQIQRALQG